MLRDNFPNYFYLKLSDICADIAQVCFATLVIPFITGEQNQNMIASGIFLMVFFWLFSLWLTKYITKGRRNR